MASAGFRPSRRRAPKRLVLVSALALLAYGYTVGQAPSAVAAPDCVDLTDGAIAWWSGDGNAKDVIGGLNGTLNGDAAFAAGKVGQAFSLDGSGDFIDIPHNGTFNAMTSALSVEAWIKVDDFTGDAAYAGIVTKGDSSWRMQRGASGNTGQFGSSGLSNVDLTGATPIDDNQWHHLVATFDSATQTKSLYLDGNLDAQATGVSGTVPTNGFNVQIGHNQEVGGRYWNGLIDEVTLYDRALSEAEVDAIVAADADGKCKPGESTKIAITSSVGIPDRCCDNQTFLAVDGNLVTGTYTTPSGNAVSPSYLAFGFSLTSVNRIRLYKDAEYGPHDLTIDYTTGTGSLAGRTWTTVNVLSNGFAGTELLNATAVNAGGTVTGDAHDSRPNAGNDGWASLTFEAVQATGVRIGFTTAHPNKHYHVYEFEAHFVDEPMTFTPTRFDDPAPNGCYPSDCSLREAVIAANGSPTADTIDVPAGTYNLTRAGVKENASSTGDLDVTEDVTIVGADAATTIIDANDIDRVLHVLAGATASVSGVTIRNGTVVAHNDDGGSDFLCNDGGSPSDGTCGWGGGINNAGTLTLSSSTVSDNVNIGASGVANAFGGGILNHGGTLTLDGVTVTGNQAVGSAGHFGSGVASFIYVATTIPNTTITDSTVSGNDSGPGILGFQANTTITRSTVSGNNANGSTSDGGILADSGYSLNITNSTISGNRGSRGAGIYTRVPTSLTNVTVTANTVGFGVYDSDGPDATATNTIVAGNAGNCHSALSSNGYNLESGSACGFTGTGDLQSTDPLLGPLADNDGPTMTHAIGSASPAFDAGTSTGAPATDQRGVARPFGAAVDIGAFEASPIVLNTNDSGTGSLRDAILLANGAPGHDDITFDIPGTAATYTITPASSLPTITEEVTIDGYTQYGAEPADGSTPATVLIDLDGSLLGNSFGLNVSAGPTTIRGLQIRNFTSLPLAVGGAGIFLNSTANGSTIAGNYIGTDAAGNDLGNGTGVYVSGASNVTIGGSLVADRNIISRNKVDGIRLFGGSGNDVEGNYIGVDDEGDDALGNTGPSWNTNGVNIDGSGGNSVTGNVISDNKAFGVRIGGIANTDNVVRGNFIGTDAAGEADLGNGAEGVRVEGSSTNVTIGGAGVGEGNVISGNSNDGVRFSSPDTTGNTVLGNYIGTNADGDDLGNAIAGVRFVDGSDTEIGGTGPGEANTIAYNGGAGVIVAAGTGNAIRGNSIHDNDGAGIDLGGDGITGNDTDDPDPGPNGLQNFPVVGAAGPGSTRIKGSLNSAASTLFDLDVYSSPSCDATNGEGKTYLGSTQVTTDSGGDAAFDVTFAATTPTNDVITATATDPNGNTSEFSACRTVISARDFGDAPDTYGTQLDSGGPSHEAGGPRLGATRDSEPDAETPLDGTGDDATGSDDEDGVTLGIIPIGGTANVTVNVSNATDPDELDGFVDFNRDGDFTDAGEQVFTGTDVSNGNNALVFSVPAGASGGDSYARFRISTAGGLSTGGAASDGEVEDYPIFIGHVDLETTKTVSGTNVPGGTLSYSVTVTNIGDATATGMTVSDPVPTGTAFVAGTLSDDPSCSFASNTVTCNVGTLASSASFVFDFDVTVGEDITSTIVNTATASAAGDTDGTNDSATTNTATACTKIGSSGSNVIYGTSGADTICLKGGNDVAYGLAGNDRIFGGSGSDQLRGGDGNDLLNGGSGNDVLYGENGNDTVIGGPGSDSCSGGTGTNTVNC